MRLFATLLVLLFSLGTLVAQDAAKADPPDPSKQEAAAGFRQPVRRQDARRLAGGREEPPRGRRRHHALGERGGNLYTKKEYGDFILRFDFKLEAGANNGIGIRTPLTGDAAYVGMEIQVLDDGAKEYKSLQPYQYHGSIYGVVPAQQGHLQPVGQWNAEEMLCQGRHVKVTLNSAVIVDANLDKVLAARDGKTLDGHEHPGLKRTRASSPCWVTPTAWSSATSASRSFNRRLCFSITPPRTTPPVMLKHNLQLQPDPPAARGAALALVLLLSINLLNYVDRWVLAAV